MSTRLIWETNLAHFKIKSLCINRDLLCKNLSKNNSSKTMMTTLTMPLWWDVEESSWEQICSTLLNQLQIILHQVEVLTGSIFRRKDNPLSTISSSTTTMEMCWKTSQILRVIQISIRNIKMIWSIKISTLMACHRRANPKTHFHHKCFLL